VTPERELAIKRKAAAHPDRPGERCNAPKGTWAPVVNHGRCEGKTDCVIVCPHDVFEVRTIDRADFRKLNPFERIKVVAHRGQTAYTPNADQCAACGLCVVACPERAIKLIEVAATTGPVAGPRAM
jgi:NAD-dependent dihydropyrimidine dehydrogenase PreA subunit